MFSKETKKKSEAVIRDSDETVITAEASPVGIEVVAFDAGDDASAVANEPTLLAVHKYVAPGHSFMVTGSILGGIGFALLGGVCGWTIYQAINTVLNGAQPIYPTPLLGIGGLALGVLSLGVASIYFVVGSYLNRNERRPSNKVTYFLSSLPVAVFAFMQIVTPAFYAPVLHHWFPVVLGVFLWNAIGLTLALRTQKYGPWITFQWVFVIPALLAIMNAPAVLTVMQAMSTSAPK